MNRLEFAQEIVRRAHRLGAEEAETYTSDTSSSEIQIRNGRADTVTYRETSGYGIRVLIDGKMGFASSNNRDLREAEALIKKLISNSRLHSPDEHNIFPEPSPSAKIDATLEKFDSTMATIPVERKIAKAAAVGEATLKADSRISSVAWLQYGDAAREYAVASSRGIAVAGRRSEAYTFVMAVGMAHSPGGAPDPDTAQTGTVIDVKGDWESIDPDRIGRKAAAYTVRMIGAQDGNTSELAGIFPPETGYNFIKLIADMSRADLIQKKKSLFTGRLNEMVASEQVTIIDDARLPGLLGSASFDAEGVPTTTKEIISSGRLSMLLYDTYTAHRAGSVSSGNADRASFDSRPAISPANFYLKPGIMSRDALIASVAEGLYVTELTGLHASVNLVSGNYSIPAKGLLISKGELTTPVANITISGNIFDFFRGIDGIADDLAWEIHESVIGTPTFRVSSIKIGGK